MKTILAKCPNCDSHFSPGNMVLREDYLGLKAAFEQFANHDSWRCGHPDRYWEDGQCPCGLTEILDSLGIAYEEPS